MQHHNWNDLKYFIALARAGTLTKAALVSNSDATTVSRRIKQLEQKLGYKLLLRSDNGVFQLTDIGLQTFQIAEVIEKENQSVLDLAGQLNQSISGDVCISATPLVINHLLMPNLLKCTQLHPDLNIELVSQSENVNLNKREADIAIRLARPTTGGTNVKATKIGRIEFGVYAPIDITQTLKQELAWITYTESYASLPQANWLNKVLKGETTCASTVKVSDVLMALEAVANNLGKSLLPDFVASKDKRLQRIEPGFETELPTREIWLLSHRDSHDRPSVTAVRNWIKSISDLR